MCHACSWDKYVVVGKGYTKMDKEVSMNMRGELFEVLLQMFASNNMATTQPGRTMTALALS